MRKVERSELVDWQTYDESRAAFRADVMAAKDRRRVHVGDHLTFLFENPLTIRYQVQEMMRAEQIVKEKEILHELDTYNGLLPDDDGLGATLLIEIDDRDVRDVKLREWLDLPNHLYAELEDGTRVRPVFDAGQIGEERLSSVQYLQFPVGGRVPVALGSDLPALHIRAALSGDQRAALTEDLGVPAA